MRFSQPARAIANDRVDRAIQRIEPHPGPPLALCEPKRSATSQGHELMVAAAVPAPGTSPAAGKALLGLPICAVADAGGVLRSYLVSGEAVTVCFERGQAIAFHVSHHADCRPFGARCLRPSELRLLGGDTGRAVATTGRLHRLDRAAGERS